MTEHKHQWTNGPVLGRSRVSSSPCSTSDDHLWTDVIQSQTCGCGETRKLLMGFKNRRRRGDDARRANGLRPLGTPLEREGIYSKSKVLK